MNYSIFYFSENLTREKIIIPVWPAPSVSGSGGQMEAATLDLALNSLPRRRKETSNNTQNTRQQEEASCRQVGRLLHLTPLCLMIWRKGNTFVSAKMVGEWWPICKVHWDLKSATMPIFSQQLLIIFYQLSSFRGFAFIKYGCQRRPNLNSCGQKPPTPALANWQRYLIAPLFAHKHTHTYKQLPIYKQENTHTHIHKK